MVRKKKQSHDLDKYIIFCFTVIIIYTIVHTVIFALTGQEASTLSVLVFGVFGTSEPILCAIIKIYKLKTEPKTEPKAEPKADMSQGGSQG